MRRYLLTVVAAEVLAFIAIFPYCQTFGAHNRSLQLIMPVVPLDFFLSGRARDLAFQLDLLDSAPSFFILSPSIAVLGLWTWDRRRQQKRQA